MRKNTGTQEKIVPPPEGELREELKRRLGELSPVQLTRIEEFAASSFPELSGRNVVEAVYKAIETATLSTHWANEQGPEGRVEIGYYSSPAQYFTGLLHEAGHNSLGHLKVSTYHSHDEVQREEDFCWGLAKCISIEASIPYSSDTEWLGMQSVSLLQDSDTPEVFKLKHTELVEIERANVGFSAQGGDTFYWTEDGIPIAIAP